jgi:hypothetical protein
MPSIADNLLQSCAANVEQLHGEPIEILSGLDAGRTFTGVREVESDVVLSSDLGEDSRPRIVIRFRNENVPRITGQGRVRTSDGRQWQATRIPGNIYLTTDFELREMTPLDK